MYGFIDGVDFHNLDAEKYWSFPKNYKGDKKVETKTMITSGNYIGAEKKDGHYARFIKDEDGKVMLQGRTPSVDGTYHNKIEWVPQCEDFFAALPNGTCLLGELYFPEQRGSRKVTTILGCLKSKAIERQEKGEKIHFYIFDVWAYNNESYLNKTMVDRVATINSFKDNFTNDFVEFANYSDGEELWNELGEVLSSGGEGIVITQKNSKPAPGKRTARKTLKVKMEIEQTLDVFLDGNYKPATYLYTGKSVETWPYWRNEKTNELTEKNKYYEYNKGEAWTPVTKAFYNGWASSISISVMRDGKPFHLGWISGIPDEIKQNIVTKNEEYKNKVVEVTAMEVEKIDGNYSLRHAKIVQWREDKRPEDCDFSQIE